MPVTHRESPLTRAGRWGLGCAQLGNLYEAISDEDSAGIVSQAWDEGVRYFDTAPHYGLGLSERRLGAALAGRPRAEFVVSTKVGRLLEPDPAGAARRDEQGFDVPADQRRVWDFSRDGVWRSLDASLTRLGLDRVDILYVHDPDTHFEVALTEALPALVELREQGVVDAIGFGMNQTAMLAEFVRRSDPGMVDLLMVAGRYTLLNQPALDELLPLCAERGVGVVAAGAYNAGILSTPEPGRMYDYAEAPAELVARATRIAQVCARFGIELPTAALALPAAHPTVAAVVVGAQSAAQVRENLARTRAVIPAGLWASLKAEGLLRTDAPVPSAV